MLTKKQIADLQAKLQKINALPKEKQATAIQKLSPEEMQFLQEQQCVFCKIAKSEVKSEYIIYEDEYFLAFLDISPISPGHTLVIPKEHYAILPQLPDNLDAAYLKLIKVIASAAFEAVSAQGINIIQNNGAVAGQVVPHVHFHIIPRFENDGVKLDESKPIKLTAKQMKEIQKRIIKNAKGKVTKKTPIYDMSGKELTGKEIKKSKKRKTKRITKVKPRMP